MLEEVRCPGCKNKPQRLFDIDPRSRSMQEIKCPKCGSKIKIISDGNIIKSKVVDDVSA